MSDTHAVWWYLDGANQSVGPVPHKTISDLIEKYDVYVWRDGWADWKMASELPEFAQPSSNGHDEAVAQRRIYLQEKQKCMTELMAVCKAVLFDERVNKDEAEELRKFLEMRSEYFQQDPLPLLKQRLIESLEDDVLDQDEQDELK